MHKRTLLIATTFLFTLGIFVFVYIQQQLLMKEIDTLTPSSPVAVKGPETTMQNTSGVVSRGKPYRIDPHNDPLAPVVRKTPQPEPSRPDPSLRPAKTHERSLDSPVLIQ